MFALIVVIVFQVVIIIVIVIIDVVVGVRFFSQRTILWFVLLIAAGWISSILLELVRLLCLLLHSVLVFWFLLASSFLFQFLFSLISLLNHGVFVILLTDWLLIILAVPLLCLAFAFPIHFVILFLRLPKDCLLFLFDDLLILFLLLRIVWKILQQQSCLKRA